jgi:dTDP-4-amino-4,6-dideoxygalactose transaminase
MGFRSEDFPHAMDYYQEALTLPLYPTLTESDQTALVAALEQAVTT